MTLLMHCKSGWAQPPHPHAACGAARPETSQAQSISSASVPICPPFYLNFQEQKAKRKTRNTHFAEQSVGCLLITPSYRYISVGTG